MWHVRLFPDGHRPPALRVADETAHHPLGEGFLRVPTKDGDDVLIKCFWTPSLPAMILSPDATGKQLHCAGFSSYSSFYGGQSYV
jgi:hypothetical protein